MLNHVGRVVDLRRFVDDARAEGLTIPIIAAVAVYSDERSAGVLQNFPGLHVDADQIARVLSAPDPVRAGIDAAVREAQELLAIDGVDGVNLSGLGSGRGEVAGAEVKAAVGERALT